MPLFELASRLLWSNFQLSRADPYDSYSRADPYDSYNFQGPTPMIPTKEGEKIPAYPVNKIPSEAIESPSIFNDYELLRLGGPFSGFSLPGSEGWKSPYSFSMKEEYYHKLKGEIVVEVQIIDSKKREWHSVHKEEFDFGTNPIHLQGLVIGRQVTGVLINHVFSSTWNKRREMTGL